MFGMARFLGVSVFLPDVVEAECEAEWLRRFDVRPKQLTGALDALAAHTGSFKRPRIELPSVAEARADYLRRTEVTKDAFGIVTSTLTGRPLADLILNAAQHAFPFPASDSGFRDAVILLSVLEHVGAAAEPILVFLVSDDTFFAAKGTALPNGSEIRTVVKDLKSVDDVLRHLYAKGILTKWTADNQKLSAVLDNDKAAPAAFLTSNLSIPIGFSFFGMSAVKAVHGLTLKKIHSVSTSLTIPSERAADTVERVSFRALVTVHETIESSSVRSTISALRVGQEMPPQEAFSLQPPQLAEVDVDFDIAVEADAHIIAGEYVGLAYASAKIGERVGN
jgi:hypothetical protein